MVNKNNVNKFFKKFLFKTKKVACDFIKKNINNYGQQKLYK